MSMLTTLPTELLSQILDYLDAPDLARVSRVSARLHDVVTSSASLQYKFELYQFDLEDGPYNNKSKAEKRMLLERYRKAWSANPWKPSTSRAYPLMEGPLWELCGGVFAQSKGRRLLDFTQLPSHVRGIAETNWVVTLDFDVADFCIDPSQDLIAAVEVLDTSGNARMHLLRLQTGEKHPKARRSSFDFEIPPHEDFGPTFNIRICGSYVAVLTRTGHALEESFGMKFVIIDWHLGAVKFSYLDMSVYSFVFLDSQYVLLGHDCYDLATDASTAGLTVADFTAGVGDDAKLTRAITFHCPNFADGWAIANLELACDPSPKFHSNPITNAPFFVRRNQRIISMKITAVDADWEHESTQDLFVFADTFLDRIRNAPLAVDETIPWEEWGTDNCCIMPAFVPSSVWCYPAYGTRVVSRERKRLIIYNFSRPAVSNNFHTDGGTLITETTIRPTLFKDTVTTFLPFRKYSTQITVNSGDAVMINEDSVVVVKASVTVIQKK
ncbi:hypothetical protein K474DRAFT_1673681 [Panus rudis PR-1116 ss-1]|nr:hypothetical protein K474DRAFT_1673681 [Panus rudis PR-1116 ss-1]